MGDTVKNGIMAKAAAVEQPELRPSFTLELYVGMPCARAAAASGLCVCTALG